MASVSTDHRTDENGDQLTERTVTVDGDEHVFTVEYGEHIYQGDGDPPAAAVAALDDYAAANPGEESTREPSDDDPEPTTSAPAYGGDE